MSDRPNVSPFVAVLLALGLAVCGWFVGNGFVTARTVDRYVTVKGVAERDVSADLALWPLQVVATSNDLRSAQTDVNQSVDKILTFLDRHGVDTTGVDLQGLEVTDRLANRYGGDQGGAQTRFIVQQAIMVRSDDPETVAAAGQQVGELVEAGVVLSSGTGFGPAQPTFLFTRLNDVKPEMIAEATASAREAAEQFAADSNSRVGGIRRASQGVFQILPRDQAPGITETSQLHKSVRVVSTIDYYLE
ncbi:MAG TPA: SIMPL domain-containing protein [bacterium]|nr:SIMPL domain-containing protein [bacterium]